ncbi:AAA family ATPase [Shewanella sp. ULN5]|uniref:AAA family ATPase n=1 Tax=Shewanella sp. ULN5 TaxID=2994678 RepID=UPI00273D6759|nr:AAA family ATPase [Shewanella sp. ULN5]MDP5148341.1 AAA family ATPase [Shewanella sp. ULN5]
MPFSFIKYSRSDYLPQNATHLVCLKEDNWDDFGFKTIFTVVVYDETGRTHDLGNVKIGYKGQSDGWTSERIERKFTSLDEDFFSLGQEPEYYEKINNDLSEDCKSNLLNGLRDIAFNNSYFEVAKSDETEAKAKDLNSVFNVSLLRNVSPSVITEQFRRILDGGSPLTEYNFFYEKPKSDSYSGVKVEFEVDPSVKPSSNIHILIGPNGVGKTTLLNNMVKAILPDKEGSVADAGGFFQQGYFGPAALEDDYFRGVVSVSFSAFDPFDPPSPRPNKNDGICYNYIGLKTINQPNYNNEDRLKTTTELCSELVESLKVCLSVTGKRKRWVNAVQKLESDINFSDMNLCSLIDIEREDESENRDELGQAALAIFSRLSSGHAIVLLTLTKLVETIEEKTLVLIDEPESHLHPPLLSAFMRALSDLLMSRNGVAIIATHSPVVLQETPKTCVSILRRSRLEGGIDKPTIETFGENVGTLTREVFHLEVSKSGFYDLLLKSVQKGKSYEQILEEYQNQLGFEGQAIVRALIANIEE